jgi:hypothetical protein
MYNATKSSLRVRHEILTNGYGIVRKLLDSNFNIRWETYRTSRRTNKAFLP